MIFTSIYCIWHIDLNSISALDVFNLLIFVFCLISYLFVVKSFCYVQKQNHLKYQPPVYYREQMKSLQTHFDQLIELYKSLQSNHSKLKDTSPGSKAFTLPSFSSLNSTSICPEKGGLSDIFNRWNRPEEISSPFDAKNQSYSDFTKLFDDSIYRNMVLERDTFFSKQNKEPSPPGSASQSDGMTDPSLRLLQHGVALYNSGSSVSQPSGGVINTDIKSG